MNSAHVHLILNHLPIAGMLFSVPLLAFAWWRKSNMVALIGLLSACLSGIVCIPTYLTGEPTEELIEHAVGVSEKLIKIHEEAAEKTIWMIGVAAAFASIGLILRFKKGLVPRSMILVTLLLSLCSVGFLAWTNNLGGQIRHPEIRGSIDQNAPIKLQENEKDDDD